MKRLATAFVALLALAAMTELSAARDGCGRGFFWNGYRCAPMGYAAPGPGYGYYGARAQIAIITMVAASAAPRDSRCKTACASPIADLDVKGPPQLGGPFHHAPKSSLLICCGRE